MLDREAAPLRQRALEQTRAYIVNNIYPPGSRLKEKSLCDEFGVSRTVIREVLRQLETERLVRIQPNVGPIVVSLTLEDVRGLYQVRGVLEATAGRFAAEKATDVQLQRLVKLYNEIVGSPSRSLEELLARKTAFYDALVAASGNKFIGEMLANVQARISQLRRLTLSHPGRRDQMVAELGAIVQAIVDRSPDAAHSACIAHVKSAEAIAVAGFANMTSAPSAPEPVARKVDQVSA